MKIIDLTFPYDPGVYAVVPGHPQVSLTPIDTHEEIGKSNTLFSLPTHSGTHIDCPYHFYPEGQTIDEVPLERFMGPGIKLDLPHLGVAGAVITLEEVQKAAREFEHRLAGAILVITTGWARKMYRGPDYYTDSPHLAVETCEWLVEQKVNMICLDNPPGTRGGRDSTTPNNSFQIHRVLLGGNILIAENLMNVEQLPASGFRISALPLRIHRGDGAPARIIAIIDG